MTSEYAKIREVSYAFKEGWNKDNLIKNIIPDSLYKLFVDELLLRIYMFCANEIINYDVALWNNDVQKVLDPLVCNFILPDAEVFKEKIKKDYDIYSDFIKYMKYPSLLSILCFDSESNIDYLENISGEVVSTILNFVMDNYIENIKIRKKFIADFFPPNVDTANQFLFSAIFNSDESLIANEVCKKSYIRNLKSFLKQTGEMFFNGYTGNMTVENYCPSLAKQSSEKTATAKATAVAEMPVATKVKSYNEEELDTAMKELWGLIGLDAVKNEVSGLVNSVKTTNIRKAKGMKVPTLSLHLVFTGNPGTGKTTVARLIARIYKALGVISKAEIVEVARNDLVAGYVGQTAIKTQEVLQRAFGGVLFIDEAYTLAKEGNDYGQESIDTILKFMEDNRDNIIVIAAGYTNEMKEFINSNPGLQSRFNRYIVFPDYTSQELSAIFVKMLRDNDFIFDEGVSEIINDISEKVYNNKGQNFANARTIRNIFEKTYRNYENRIANINNPSDIQLQTIIAEDFSGAY